MSPIRTPLSPRASAPHTLQDMPPELTLHLLSFLPLRSLLSLSAVSSYLHSLIVAHSLPAYLRSQSYTPVTVAATHDHGQWSDARRAIWSAELETSWAEHEAGAEVLQHSRSTGGGGWERKCMPLVKLWPRQSGAGKGRLVLARGEELELWEVVDNAGRAEQVPMRPFFPKARKEGAEDVTGLAIVGGKEDELVLSRVSGLTQRVKVIEPRWDAVGGRWEPGRLVEVARYSSVDETSAPIRARWSAQSLSLSADLLATISTLRPSPTFRRRPSPSSPIPPGPHPALDLASLAPSSHSHRLTLQPLSSPWVKPVIISLKSKKAIGKPWSVLLQPSSATSPSWLALGHSALAPLSLSFLHSTGDSAPFSPLCAPQASGKPSAVYSLCGPSPLSASLHPTQTVIAAFYDSTTRIFDLRTPLSGAEVARLRDPWADDPSYAVASGGPAGAWVVTGAARGGAVRVWDIRSALRHVAASEDVDKVGKEEAGGATLFAPAQDRSPIYSLAVESSRIWGVTDRRAFVLDFDSSASASLGGRGKGGWHGPQRQADGVRWMQHEGEGRGMVRQAQSWAFGAGGSEQMVRGGREGEGEGRGMRARRW